MKHVLYDAGNSKMFLPRLEKILANLEHEDQCIESNYKDVLELPTNYVKDLINNFENNVSVPKTIHQP